MFPNTLMTSKLVKENSTTNVMLHGKSCWNQRAIAFCVLPSLSFRMALNLKAIPRHCFLDIMCLTLQQQLALWLPTSFYFSHSSEVKLQDMSVSTSINTIDDAEQHGGICHQKCLGCSDTAMILLHLFHTFSMLVNWVNIVLNIGGIESCSTYSIYTLYPNLEDCTCMSKWFFGVATVPVVVGGGDRKSVV